MSASDEQYIANVEIDEAVFENAKPCDIAMIESIMVEDKEKIGGSTFAWKDKLKVLGFKYDPEYQLWLIETPAAQTSMAFSTRWRTTASPHGHGRGVMLMGEPERERMCGLCL